MDLCSEFNAGEILFDDRDYLTVGEKFNEWEKKGVPVRIEIGEKEAEKSMCQVVRRDDGEVNNPTNLLEASKIVVNLNDSRLIQYKGAQRYGYVAMSQADATWSVQVAPGSGSPVYDTSTNQLWSYDYTTNSWSTSTVAPVDVLDVGRMYFNNKTNGSYWVNNIGKPNPNWYWL